MGDKFICPMRRCQWRGMDGLCPPFRGDICPYGNVQIMRKGESAPTSIDAESVAEAFIRRRQRYMARRRKKEAKERNAK